MEKNKFIRFVYLKFILIPSGPVWRPLLIRGSREIQVPPSQSQVGAVGSPFLDQQGIPLDLDSSLKKNRRNSNE